MHVRQCLERDRKWNFDVRLATHLEDAREGASARCSEAPMGRISAEDSCSSGKCNKADAPETKLLREVNDQLSELIVHVSDRPYSQNSWQTE